MPDYKGWAELVTVPETAVFKLPENMSYTDAVAITMNYVVAYIILFDLSCLTPGKSLLVHSAGGGVVSDFTYYISISSPPDLPSHTHIYEYIRDILPQIIPRS